MIGEDDGLSQQNKATTRHENSTAQVSRQPDTKDVVPTEDAGVTTHSHTWSIDQLPNEVSIRGGGCAASLLCCLPEDGGQTELQSAEIQMAHDETHHKPQKSTEEEDQEQDDQSDHPNHQPTPVWTGWAELENDPEIFTILLQDWGVPNVHVNEILDLVDLTLADPADTLGLIFLSRYVPPDETTIRASSPAKINGSALQENETIQPWFANQISKFSCGTVALMNILMNGSPDADLSEILSSFKHSTSPLSSKNRGMALDTNPQFRAIHNSFSTKLDRMIVDVMLKEDAQKHKQRLAAQARQAKLAEKQGTGNVRGTKRKRGGTTFTKRRKKKSAVEIEDENGFHFVAYVSANNSVWKLDGMLSHPCNIGRPDSSSGQTWLNVAAADLLPQMEEALTSGQECSLMSVAKTSNAAAQDEAIQQMQKAEKERKQEDWAPFIEHMLRLHAERGDLQEMLGLEYQQ